MLGVSIDEQIRTNLVFNHDALAKSMAADPLDRPFDQSRQRVALQFEIVTTTSEIEQLAQHGVHALNRLQLALKQDSPLFRREAVTVERLRGGGDRGKRIAQIMYDRSCHLPDRRQTLAPEQFRLCLFERAPHLIECTRQGA